MADLVNLNSIANLVPTDPQATYLLRTDKNGTKYFGSYCCPKCNGRGEIRAYWYIAGGVCFKCGGSGVLEKMRTWKEYTPEYAAKLEAKRAEREAKRAEQGAKKEAAKKAKEEAEKAERIAKWKEAHPEAAKAAEILHNFPNTSDYFGEVGEKIEIEALYVKCYEYEAYSTRYDDDGTRFAHVFAIDGKKLIWHTASRGNIYERGKTYKLKATIKEHSEYKGTKQTVLTRCKIS